MATAFVSRGVLLDPSMRSRMWLHLCERRGGLLSEIEPLSVGFNPFELYQHQ